MVAMVRGPEPVRICERSSSKGWVDRGDFTPSPSENRTWTSQLIRLLPMSHLVDTLIWYLKWLCFRQKLLLISQLTFGSSSSANPLGSTSVTAASQLLRGCPPLCDTSILSASPLSLRLSLNIVATGSHGSLKRAQTKLAPPLCRAPSDQ